MKRLLGLFLLLLLTLFLFTGPAAYADGPSDNTSAAVINVKVDGNLKASVNVTGPADLNVEAKGPSKVDINTDNQVDLNVEAIDPSEVTVNQQKLAEPLRSDEQNGKLVPIVAGAIPVLGLISLFFIRRRVKRG